MEPAKRFDLEREIAIYIGTMRDRGLNKSEIDELVEHFLLSSQDLIENGLRPEEAFLISKRRFGDLEMVEEEYEKAVPRYSTRRMFLNSIFLFFSIVALLATVNYISLFSMYAAGHFPNLSDAYIQVGDLILKMSSVGLLAFASYHIVARSRTTRWWPYIALPAIALLPLAFNDGISISIADSELMETISQHTIWITMLIFVSLTGIYFRLLRSDAFVNCSK